MKGFASDGLRVLLLALSGLWTAKFGTHAAEPVHQTMGRIAHLPFPRPRHLVFPRLTLVPPYRQVPPLAVARSGEWCPGLDKAGHACC